jgi:hypothetical protein
MPIPLAFPIIGTLVGGIIAGLTQFFASRGALMLAGLGLTFIGVKGFETFIGFIIADWNTVIGQLNGGGTGVSAGLAQKMVQLAAFAGFFDGLNIVLSGYMAFVSLISVKFIVGRLNS